MTTSANPLAAQAPPQFDLTTAVKDPDFLKAPPHEKVAFLAAHDADFAQAHPADQGAYLAHLLGSDQQTQFEKSNAAKPYFGFSPSNLWQQTKQGVKDLATSAYGMGKDILFPEGKTEGERISGLAKKYIFDPADAENEKAKTAPTASESIGHSVAAAIPFVGPWAASLGEQAGTGDVGGAAAKAASQIVAGETVRGVSKAAKPLVGKAASAVGDAASNAVFNEEGKMRPGVRAASRGVGALAGHATGIPGMELVGAFGGPEVVKSLTPAREPTVAKAVPLNRSPYYKQNLAKAADEAAATKAAAEADAEARKPVPVKNSPYYAANKATAESAAKAESEARQPVPVTESPYWQQNKAKAAAATKAAKQAPVIATPTNPSGGGPRFTGNEGRPATWTNERVMQLAKEGNREAIQQAVRRGMELPPNARYVAGDADFSSGAYNPRDVTTFGPDGTPIRQGGRVSAVAKPFSGAKGAMPDLSNVPEVELVEHGGARANASGEPGGGGLEEQARLESEAAQGVKYFRETPGGGRQPLTGLGRQDLRAGPGQKIIRVEANGRETVLDAQPIRPASEHLIRKKPQ